MSILQQVLTFMKSMLIQGVVHQQRVHTLVHVLAVTAVKSLLQACLGIAYTVLYVLPKVLETTKKWQRKLEQAQIARVPSRIKLHRVKSRRLLVSDDQVDPVLACCSSCAQAVKRTGRHIIDQTSSPMLARVKRSYTGAALTCEAWWLGHFTEEPVTSFLLKDPVRVKMR